MSNIAVARGGVGRALAAWLLVTSTAFGQTGSFDWATGGQALGSYAGLSWANVTVSSPRNMRINALRIDTATPGLRFYTTAQSGTLDTMTQTTRQFITASQTTSAPVVAGINATPWTPFNSSEWNQSKPANLQGLAVSQGSLVSAGDGSPAFFTTTSGAAGMATWSGTSIGGLQTAVSGFGYVLGSGSAIAGDASLHPRTGIGVSQDKRYVYFMTIDGRQTASAGATTQEVGSYLRYFGSYDGINMDGGGSTTMAWWNPATSAAALLNVPVGTGLVPNTERHNGNNIGIYYTTVPPPTAGSSVAILTSGSSFTPAGWSNLAQTYVGLAATKNTANTDTRMMGIRQDGGVDILYRLTDDGSYNIYPVPGITTVYSSITADRVTGDRFYAGKPGGGVDVLYADGASILVDSPSEWNQTYAALAATQPGGVTDYRVGAAGAAGVDTLFYLGGWATYDVPGWTTSYTSLTADQTLQDYYYAGKAGGGVDILYQNASGVFPNTWNGTYSGLAADSFTYQTIAAIKPGGGADLLTVSGGVGVTTAQTAWSGTYTAITASQVTGGTYYAVAVPEPSTYVLLLGGAAAAALARKKR